MATIECLSTGLIYRNPQPHVRSIQAYFPSVALMANGEMLATIVLGEAFEAPNLRTHVCRSTDNGETWQLEGPIYPGTTDRLTSDSSRLTALPDGEAVVFMVRCDRTDHPDEGFTNHENLGFVPTEWRTISMCCDLARPASLVCGTERSLSPSGAMKIQWVQI